MQTDVNVILGCKYINNSIYLCIYVYTDLFIYLSVNLFIYLLFSFFKDFESSELVQLL